MLSVIPASALLVLTPSVVPTKIVFKDGITASAETASCTKFGGPIDVHVVPELVDLKRPWP
jgi:hypothetical protein